MGAPTLWRGKPGFLFITEREVDGWEIAQADEAAIGIAHRIRRRLYGNLAGMPEAA